MVWLVLLLLGCDDEVFRPCGEYTSDWAGVECFLDVHCAACHADPQEPTTGEFPEEIYSDVLGGTGIFVNTSSGVAEDSQLWRVLIGAVEIGDPVMMPYEGDPLPFTEIAHIQEWLEACAPLKGEESVCPGDGT